MPSGRRAASGSPTTAGRTCATRSAACARQPGFALAATLTLALGLGLAVGLFAVVDAVHLQPLPFADQDELVVLWE